LPLGCWAIWPISINSFLCDPPQEFLAATMHLNKLNREENLIEAFKHFDKDGSGFITKDEIIVSVTFISLTLLSITLARMPVM
jgi:Ca2+-binding EF-hand superfamily protein